MLNPQSLANHAADRYADEMHLREAEKIQHLHYIILTIALCSDMAFSSVTRVILHLIGRV